MYPGLICTDSNGNTFECDRYRACDKDISKYEYNWDDPRTLDNWMTQLDLICVEPFYIGLLGSISFVCFAVGAFSFTKYADIYGRKKLVCVAAIFTPISLTLLLFFAKEFGLIFIYIVFGILGLTYNPRGSTVYLYSAELLPKDKRLLFGSLLFFIDGMFSVSASYYFYEFKS